MLCDVIVLYCMKKRYYYREKKYKYVEDYEQVSHLQRLASCTFLMPVVSTQSTGPRGGPSTVVLLGLWSAQAAAHRAFSAPLLDHHSLKSSLGAPG